jgi:hypothetical protein
MLRKPESSSEPSGTLSVFRIARRHIQVLCLSRPSQAVLGPDK